MGSRKRAATCRDYLRASGLTEQQIARLRAPVGLDIGAVTPAEIAASILAELVQVRHSTQQTSIEQMVPLEEQARIAQSEQDSNTALDPVCGMMVEIATARHHSVMDGQDFYFCCPACKRTLAIVNLGR